MANLLPFENKKKLRAEYHYRVTIIAAAAFLITVLIAGVFLLPSYFIAQSKQIAAESRVEVLKKVSESKEDRDIQAALATANKKLSILASSEHEPISKHFETVIALRPSGIGITSLFYGRTAQVSHIDLEGYAKTREALLAFKKALERQSSFTEIILPITHLVKENDINFSMTIHGDF